MKTLLLLRYLSILPYSSIVVIVIIILSATILIHITATAIELPSYQGVFAHLSGNKIQEWISQRNNIKILFTYEPEKPIIDTFTELKFSVLNLTTGEHLKDFVARAVVTNGQRLFKFENITVADGDFSVKYLFPDDGTHQVITRIDAKESITLASFNVFVPHQQPPSLMNPFPSSSSPYSQSNANSNNEIQSIVALSIIIGIAVGIGAFTLYLVRKK